MDLEVKKIKISGWNPRKNFNKSELQGLQESIKKQGICQPLLVRPLPENGSFQLVAGERRLRAAKALKMKTVPVLIKDLTDEQAREIMLIENLERKDLSPLEEADFIQGIINNDGITQEELAKKIQRSQAWIANRLRLLKLPGEIQALIISREINSRHGIALLPFAGYPVFKVIMKEIRKQLKAGKEVSVRYLNDTIIGDAVGGYNDDFVLDLDDFPFNKRDLQGYFDFSKCKKCPAVKKTSRYGGTPTGRNCIDRRCWKDNLNKAKISLQKEKDSLLKGMKDKKVIDTNLLEYNAWNGLSVTSDPWCKTVCRKCENKKKAKIGGVICIDPKCYNRNSRSKDNKDKKKKIEEKKTAWKTVDDFLDSDHPGNFLRYQDGSGKRFEISLEILRNVLSMIVKHGHHEQLKHGVERWPDAYVKHEEYGYYRVDVSKIPDEDIPKAILRFLAAEEIDYCKNFSKEDLAGFLPEAMEYYPGGGK